MKLTRLIALLALVGAVAIACSDDDPTGTPTPGIDVFVGLGGQGFNEVFERAVSRDAEAGEEVVVGRLPHLILVAAD